MTAAGSALGVESNRCNAMEWNGEIASRKLVVLAVLAALAPACRSMHTPDVAIFLIGKRGVLVGFESKILRESTSYVYFEVLSPPARCSRALTFSSSYSC